MRKLMMILVVATVAALAAEATAQGPFFRARVRREIRLQNDLNRLAFARAGFVAPVALRSPVFFRSAPLVLPARAAFIQPATVFSPFGVASPVVQDVFGRQFIQPAALVVPQFIGSASCF